MSKTISDIETALNAAADRELEKLLEPLTKIIEDDRLRGYTNSEVIQSAGAPGVLVKQRTPCATTTARSTFSGGSPT